jgi:F0F1-type ATP synthase assembly protein I
MFAGGVLMFMGGGWLLDGWIGLFPLFTIVGALLGTVLSMMTLYRHVTEMDRREKQGS